MTALLLASGFLAIAVAILHGYLGETRLIAPATFASGQARRFVSAMWQLTTALWITCGAVIAAAPWIGQETRRWAVLVACLPLLWGVVANIWITRGRHIGGQLMGVAVAMALLGASL